MTSNAQIRVREATPADAKKISEIMFDAFDNDVANHIMYPNGYTDEIREKYEATLFPAPYPAEETEEDDKAQKEVIHRLMVELLPDGEPIASASWAVRRHGLPDEDWTAPYQSATEEMLGTGSDVAFFNAFIGGMVKARKRIIKGDPAMLLKLCIVSPSKQRLGAGSALVKWGTDLADELGLPCYLESSPSGYNMYKKHGFESIEVLDLNIGDLYGAVRNDGDNWGAGGGVEIGGPLPEGWYRSVVMRRLPRARA